jgi:hypothetical protein
MHRKAMPTEIVIRETLALAVLLGEDNLTAIQRDLDNRLEHLRQEQDIHVGDTPDPRTIKWIINDYLNSLSPEAAVANFPPHILQLRTDYERPKRKLSQPKLTRETAREKARGPDDRTREHWAKLSEVASSLSSNFIKIRSFSDAEIAGNAIDGGSIWLDGEPPPFHFSRPDREDPRKLEKVDSYLAQRFLEHLMGHSQVNDWRKLAKEGISNILIDKLVAVAHGGIIEETTCKICKPWYE